MVLRSEKRPSLVGIKRGWSNCVFTRSTQDPDIATRRKPIKGRLQRLFNRRPCLKLPTILGTVEVMVIRCDNSTLSASISSCCHIIDYPALSTWRTLSRCTIKHCEHNVLGALARLCWHVVGPYDIDHSSCYGCLRCTWLSPALLVRLNGPFSDHMDCPNP